MLTLNPLENAGVFGCPYHGEVKNRGSAYDEILLPNGQKKRAYSSGAVYYVKHPNAPGVARTVAQQAEDARLGWQWFDYGLVSYGITESGTPGARFSGCVWFPANHYLYCDEHRAWLIRLEFIENETYPTYTDKIEIWLVGVFGGAVCEIKLATVTLNYWMQIDSSVFSDLISIAPSPNGRKWFINTYETYPVDIGTYWAANSIFVPYVSVLPSQRTRILREVFSVSISGNGAITGTIGDGISAAVSLHKSDSETFVFSSVEGPATPGCPSIICPEGDPGDLVSGESVSSYSSTAYLGYWYDKDGNAQTGTIAYSESSLTTWEGQREETGVCYLFFHKYTSKTMTRTIVLPTHTESQTDTYSSETICGESFTETGLLHGRWGEWVSITGGLFAQYAFDGYAGVANGTTPGLWFSTRAASASDHVTIDMYGNKTTNAAKRAIVLHPLTGDGDQDTIGWI